ncbi:MAG: DUF2752 domain-containing protein [Prevotella sp.]|nr:DUF2752 domain-containing protein [Prevotella sp.]
MNRNLKHCGGVTVTLAIPLILSWISPDIASKESLCPSMRLWHFPCPGCGITKSIIFLYRGELQISFSYHPFGIVLAITLVLLLFAGMVDWLNHTDLFCRLLEMRWLWQVLAVAVFVMWVVNLIKII